MIIKLSSFESSPESFSFLMGQCRGDFDVCWPKMLKYLTENLLYNTKSLLEHRKANMKIMFFPRKKKL